MRPHAARHRPRHSRLPALLLAGLAAVAGAAESGSGAFADAAASVHVRYGQLTLDQAIEMAERRFHARVVRAGVEEANGQRIFVLRLLSEQGRVWTVRVDAQSGSII